MGIRNRLSKLTLLIIKSLVVTFLFAILLHKGAKTANANFDCDWLSSQNICLPVNLSCSNNQEDLNATIFCSQFNNPPDSTGCRNVTNHACISTPPPTNCTMTILANPFPVNTSSGVTIIGIPGENYGLAVGPGGCGLSTTNITIPASGPTAGIGTFAITCNTINTTTGYLLAASNSTQTSTCTTQFFVTPGTGNCGAEGQICCTSAPVCQGSLVCNNNTCEPNTVTACGDVCNDPVYAPNPNPYIYPHCGSGNPDPTSCQRPPGPLDTSHAYFDCNISGTLYDCYCCNQYISSSGPTLPPPSPIAQNIFCVGPNNPTPTNTNTGYILTGAGCVPANNLQNFLTTIIPWAIGISGGIAILLIIYAGFLISTSAGDPRRLMAGKELLTAAISGLMLLIFASFLLRLIGVDILKIPGF